MSIDERAIRVFVSSTFRDMQLERDELVKRVFPRIRQLCEQRGLSWSEIDLRWGVTDEQKAEGAVLPICLAEIERTRPYFIGLLGQRYGWVPDEIPPVLVDELGWLAEDKDRSVTELEILHGVLNDPEAGGHAFFYLRDPAWVESLDPRERADFVEDSPLGAQRLQQLRQRIRSSGHPTSGYGDPQALGEIVLADLTRLIETRFPDSTQPDETSRTNSVHDAFGRARFGVFVERPRLAAVLDRHASSDGPPLLVTGESGVGASALVTRWAQAWALSHPGDRIVVHHVDADAEAADHRATVARIVAAMATDVSEDTDRLATATPSELRRALTRAWAATEGRTIMVIDGVDRLADVDGAPDLRWLPSIVPSSVRIVLTASDPRVLTAVEHRSWPSLGVPALDTDERRQIVVAVLAAASKGLDTELLDALTIARRTGNARFLRTVLDELRQHGDHFTLRSEIDRLTAAETVDDLLELVLARYEADFDRDRPGLTRAVFTSLWAARRGLSEAELLELLADREGVQLPQAVWAPLHLAAAEGLVSRGGLLGFAHPDLRRAVEDRYLTTEHDRHLAHARLAEFFGRAPLSRRVVEELGWQQADAGDLDGLRSTLTDLTHLELAYRHQPADVRRLWSRLVSTGDESGPALVEAYRTVLDDPAVHDLRPGGDDGDRAEPRQLVWGIARLLSDAGAAGAALGLHRYLVGAARLAPEGSEEPSGGDRRLRAALVNLGAAEWSSGALPEAAVTLAEVVVRCRDAGDDRMLSSAVGNLAMTRRDLGQFAEAAELFTEEQRLCRQLDDEFGLQAGLGNHAEMLRTLGRYDDALELLHEQERLCRDLAEPSAIARSLAARAAVLADRGNLEEAASLTEQHVDIARQEGDVRGLAEAQLNLAVTRLELGDASAAAEAGDEAESLARRLADPGLLTKALVARAIRLGQAAQWTEAERSGREAELTARQADLPLQVALALGQVGVARRELGDLTGARHAHEAELAAADEAANELAIATARCNLGTLAVAEQRFDDALGLYALAEQTFRRIDIPGSLLTLLANRGQVHHLAGRPAEALADFTDAAETAARLGVPTSVQQWAEPAVQLAYQTGDTTRAEKLWTLIESASRATDDQPGLQRALGEHALLLINQAQPEPIDAALRMLDEQEAICHRTGDMIGLAACVGNRAIALRHLGDLDGALHCVDRQLEVAARSGNAQGALFATANRGELLGLLGRVTEARAALGSARATATQYGLTPMVDQLDSMIDALPEPT